MSPVFPPETRVELEGWCPAWARLVPMPGLEAALDRGWAPAHEAFRQRFAGRKLTDDPVVGAIRRLFRAAGCDPTRYRPSSEALARRVLRGDTLPRIHPLVDLNNLVSLELMVPCCVLNAARVAPPFVLRSGREGERMQSMRGPFDLAGKPLLADEEGPLGTPITDSERVKIRAGVEEAWLVAYLPESGPKEASFKQALARISRQASA